MRTTLGILASLLTFVSECKLPVLRPSTLPNFEGMASTRVRSMERGRQSRIAVDVWQKITPQMILLGQYGGLIC